jgi:hypothetical protein
MQKPVILKRREIDEPAWNRCIQMAPHSLTYAFTWYLDAVCGNRWDALVYGNYDAVMPLPVNQKYGIRYLYQPYFCQQLGLFGPHELLPLFLEEIRKKYKYADICLHTETTALPGIPDVRKTYWLSLNPPYSELCKNYNADARKNLRRLEKQYGRLKLESDPDFNRIIDLYSAYLNPKKVSSGFGGLLNKIKPIHYNRFNSAMEEAASHGLAEGYCLKGENGMEVAAGIFLRSRNHYHLLCGFPTGAKNALHGLIDCFIAKNAESNLILDFAGSEIPEVAFFLEKFGSFPRPYFHWKWNNLPAVVRWLKP